MLRVDSSNVPPPTTASLSLNAHDPHRSSRQGSHSNVFTRLQALLPTPSSPLPPRSPSLDTTSAPSIPPPPKFLKVRIVTWNMHESLPKGDLDELLGTVPPYTPTIPLHDPAFPYLPYDEQHPYHLVVVAGQECPSLSGIPMGLGAGFKLKDKEKEKEKEKEREKEKEKDPHAHKESEEKERYLENLKELQHRLLKQRDAEVDEHSHHQSGWTSILEDWFCYGIRDIGGAANARALGRADSHGQHLKEALKEGDRAFSDTDLRRRPTHKNMEHRKGPYEMLVKERMMGIYLAVFVHRDARHLVDGTSRAAVTAGLVGGRVGNKGGVGISVKIAGRTMLFLNAHLAAHEGKILHRMANLRKIKAEMALDAFLSPDDPRMVSEDLTDKFDYTFLCGDLNFRLEVSRLHADWLIARQEYAQALSFDQLFNIMRNGQAFVGFHEAPINFPPTFKYDVLRTLKHKRKHSKYSNRPLVDETHDEKPEEATYEESSQKPGSRESSEEEEVIGEAASTVSTATAFSKKTGHDGHDSSDSLDSEDCGVALEKLPPNPKDLVKRISAKAAQKAKIKWHELVSPSTSPGSKHGARWPKNKSYASMAEMGARPPMATPSLSKESAVSQPLLAASQSLSDMTSVVHSPSSMVRASSTKSGVQSSGNDDIDEDDDKGVYDSSSKQRVPSWCDRILWKSNVKPDPEPEDNHTLQPRTLMTHLGNAWRTISTRRTSAISSVRSSDSHAFPSPLAQDGFTIPPSPTANPSNPSTTNPPMLRRPRPRSTEAMPPNARPAMSRSRSSIVLTQQAMKNMRPEMPPNRPSPILSARAATAPGTATTDPPSDSSSEGSPSAPFRDPLHLPRWRFLPSFMSRDHSDVREHPASDSLGVSGRPRQGDVICLSYSTLDDRGMRRLEGRSDHRPVIGSYAVYI